ncbi:IclR family transcriptional regulator domain-containing protein [Streptomyces racemochromogenes]|uniref:IclR family transcriptional regulator domain-containing protein n=1 Tax=Streptomyces racemochromogenes TaxID=67353 RepID=UPI0031EFB509
MNQAQESWSHDEFLPGGLPRAKAAVPYDTPGAHFRLMTTAGCPAPVPEPLGVAVGEEAAKELDALCEKVVFDVQACRRIALLAGGHPFAAEGAFAFGCLLHLVGDGEGATFWWQFAAGAEEAEAAYCLMLDHLRRAELEDAALWQERLAHTGYVADDGWRDRAAAAREQRERLNTVAAYAYEHDHEDLGPVHTPTARLAKALLALVLAAPRPGNQGEQLLPPPSLPVPMPTSAPVPGAPASAGPRTEGSRRESHEEDPGSVEPSADHSAPTASSGPGTGTGLSEKGLVGGKLWIPPGSSPDPGHTPAQWEDSLRILDVLHLVREAAPVSVPQIALTAGITMSMAASLMSWLADNSLTRPLADGLHGPGPLLAELDSGRNVLQAVLEQLRDETGAAVYVSTYTDGEIVVPHRAFGPDAPEVTITADFKESVNTHSVGKSLLSQLTPEQRKDLLYRRPPMTLTERSIVDTDVLFDTIDRYGPQGAHFDVLEYSTANVCAGISLPLAGQAWCIALALPAAEHGRLLAAADKLSNRSTGLLLALLLALHPESATRKAEATRTETADTTGTAAPAQEDAGSRLWKPPGLSLPPSLSTHHIPPRHLLLVTPH